MEAPEHNFKSNLFKSHCQSIFVSKATLLQVVSIPSYPPSLYIVPRTYYLRLCLSVRQISDIPPWTQEAWHFLCLATLSRTYYLRLCLSVRFLRASYRTLSQIRWTKAISPPKELEGGAHSTPNFNLTSQGAQRAPIWWPKATNLPQELEDWPP